MTKLEEPMVDGMKGTPGDGVFAYLQKELLKNCKDTVLEIRMDFKAPQHVEKCMFGVLIYWTPDREYRRCLAKDVKERRSMGGNPWDLKFLHLFLIIYFLLWFLSFVV